MNNSSRQKTEKAFLRAIRGDVLLSPPIWLMRQAGRYLPEYREVRAEAGSFLNLCYSPERACEVTLQPIRRYGFDAAILFSDILVVPDALGQKVEFVEGEGPRLEPISDHHGVLALDRAKEGRVFEKVFETVERIGHSLPSETALIGFCGAPYTVATYMIGGKGSPDQAVTRLFAYQNPELFQKLMDILVETSIDYLAGQVRAGAEVLQIFDSWAGNLPDGEFERWVIDPIARIVEGVKRQHPEIPIIGFPRGGVSMFRTFVRDTGVDVLGCDTSVSVSLMAELAQERIPVQGNLDPLLLVSGGEALDRRVDELVGRFSNGRYIFNLGHGIVPQTPPENVARLVERVRINAAS